MLLGTLVFSPASGAPRDSLTVAIVIAIQAIINIVVVLLVVVVVGRTAMRQLFNHRPFIICGAGHAQIGSTGARKKEQFYSVKGVS